jgi:hypothetical protein
LFLLYTATEQQVGLLRGTDPEVSSHKSEERDHFGTNLLWMAVKVYILLKQILPQSGSEQSLTENKTSRTLFVLYYKLS